MKSNDEMLVQSGVGDELRALRDELSHGPTAPTRDAHVAAMERAATELQSASARDQVVIIGRPSGARRRLRALAIPVAATVGVLGLTCGLAAAGGLPGPAQRQVARVAHAVGWNIPDHLGSSSPTPSTRPDPSHGPDRLSTSSSTNTSTTTTAAVDGAGTPTVGAGAVGPQPGPVPSIPSPSSGPAASQPPTSPSPGRSGSAPGHTTPGTAPAAPGKSGDAPGHNKSAPVTTTSTPGTAGPSRGKSGAASGHAKEAGGG